MIKTRSFIWDIEPEEFSASVKESKSFAELSRLYHGTDKNTATIKQRIQRDGLDISHFTGQAKFKGLKRPENSHPHYQIDYLLQENPEHKIHNNRLRDKLISANVLFGQCYLCGLDQWQGSSLPLQLVHINKKSHDNRVENLILLCPNCFAVVKSGKMINLTFCPCGKPALFEKNHCLKCSNITVKPSKEKLKKELTKFGFDVVEQKYRVDRETIIDWINNDHQ